MLRQATRACPLCEARSILGRPTPVSPFPQQVRLYGELRKNRSPRQDDVASRPRSRPFRRDGTNSSRNFRSREPDSQTRTNFRSRGRDTPRPSRMVLSDSVARPPPQPRTDGRPTKRRHDPFSHLNQTKAPPFLERARERQQNSGDRFPNPRKQDGKRRSRSEPFHALKMQKTLHEMSYGLRGAMKRRIEQIESFEGLPLLDSVQQAIKEALPDL